MTTQKATKSQAKACYDNYFGVLRKAQVDALVLACRIVMNQPHPNWNTLRAAIANAERSAQ